MLKVILQNINLLKKIEQYKTNTHLYIYIRTTFKKFGFNKKHVKKKTMLQEIVKQKTLKKRSLEHSATNFSAECRNYYPLENPLNVALKN